MSSKGWPARFSAFVATPVRIETEPPRRGDIAQPGGLAGAILQARHRLRSTMARTVLPPSLQPRMIAFERGLRIAGHLAAKLPGGASPGMPAAAAPAFGVRDMVELAHRALDAGFSKEGLAVLASVGMLLGGPAQAAFETALGLIRLGRPAEACERLSQAVDAMSDTAGVVSALLAQLWYEAGDRRWIEAARRVLATGADRDARTRCLALLASQPPGY